MGQHRALGAARGARRVQDRRGVFGRGLCNGEFLADRGPRGGLKVAADHHPHPAERNGLARQVWACDEQGRFGVGEEVGDFPFLVSGVERNEDDAGAQACEVQHHRGRRLVHLHQDPLARLDPQ